MERQLDGSSRHLSISMVAVLICFLLGLVARLGAVHTLHLYKDPSDASSYHQIAETLASGLGFLLEGQPTAYRTPGFPFFLSVVYRLFGISVEHGLFAQAVLGAGTIVIVHDIARRLGWIQKTCIASAAGIALYPFFIYYTADLLTETLTIFLMAGSFWAYLFWKEKPSIGRGAGWGLLLSALILTKTVFAPIVAIWLAIELWRGHRLQLLAVLWVCLLPLVGWAVRNAHVVGQATLDTHGGLTCVECMVYYEDNKAGRFSEKDSFPAPLYAQIQSMSEVQRDSFYKKIYRDFIREQPNLFIKRAALNFVDFWRLYPRLDVGSADGGKKLLLLVSLLTEPFLLAFGFWGLWRTRQRWRTLYPVYLIILLLTAAHMLTCAQMRYRLPLMIFFILFSAYSLFPPPKSR